MGSLVRWVLAKIASRLPVRVIVGSGDEPYLYKYLLWQSSERRDSWRVHLHRFVRSDEDRELHNHPWELAVSLVLAGGYREQYRSGGRFLPRTVVSRVVKPWRINVITANTFHRVELRERDCWTLFMSGPIVQPWGFWVEATDRFVPWREFIAAKGQKPAEGEYWKPVSQKVPGV